MSYLKARLSVRWPSIREHRLAKGGWVGENAEALLCKTSRRFGDLCCFPSMTCPTRAFCTGRTSEIQAIFLVAILVPVTAWLWLLAVLDAVAAPTAGRAARLCLPSWCGSSGFRLDQGSQRLSRSSEPKGHQFGGWVCRKSANAVPIFLFVIPPPCSSYL